ncbi:MAG TPA: anthranilate synthase component I [Actinomycetaceae bacterium]|nr:anthranilate synthase component I [Actinomycetaceae bacterium]
MNGPRLWGELTPGLDEFRELARDHRVIPVARTFLAEDLGPTAIYRALGGEPGTFVLESAEQGQWSRWSFVGVASRATLLSWDGTAHWEGDVPVGMPREGDVLEVLHAAIDALPGARMAGYPPLTGGFVGALGWDFVHAWEDLPSIAVDDQNLPRVALSLVSDLVAIDHHTGTVWLIANAINADNTEERVDEAWRDACMRLERLAARLPAAPSARAARVVGGGPEPEVHLQTEREDFMAVVRSAKEAIREGEVFQVVPSLRADVECVGDPLDVYRVLRATNPSPYMYLVALPDPRRPSGRIDVVGSSPETLIRVEGGTALTFPIAGSRPRGATPEEDAERGAEMLADPKERAEHIMLVDLARNDLAKSCDPASINVVEFMGIRRYSHIMHITSTVTGTLREGVRALDALIGAFPAGTLSGAPKVRAMELIDEFEPTRRGIYGGVIGYVDLAGQLDMAIAIRTAVIADGIASVQAGAGIVADSDPATEYEEARTKAAAALRAVQIASRLERP